MKGTLKKWGSAIPLPGLRVIKTVIAVVLSSLFMRYVLDQTPFFACIGAVASMEKSISHSLRAALQRNTATVCGGLLGIAFSLFTDNMLLLALGVIPLIMVHNALGQAEGIVPGAIVYFAVVYLATGEATWAYGLLRIFGTMVGSAIALLVNWVSLPRTKVARVEDET